MKGHVPRIAGLVSKAFTFGKCGNVRHLWTKKIGRPCPQGLVVSHGSVMQELLHGAVGQGSIG